MQKQPQTLMELAQRVHDFSSDNALSQAARPFCVLQDRAKLAGVDAPRSILDDDGGPSEELLTFCRTHDLPIDAVFGV